MYRASSPGSVCAELVPSTVDGERHHGAGGELRRELRAQLGVARAHEEQGEILDARVVADEHRAADLAVEAV
jgi:hypothetical protein